MKATTRARRLARITAKLLWALIHRHHPILAHIIPMRRCNLSCSYCNEYDGVSKPVPLELLHRRVDRLAELGTSVVTISGGEPLMHPEIDAVVRRLRQRGIFATLITNGYYLSPERIAQLNQAGLDHLQISIDNVEPDESSMKSLRLLEPKLRWLAELADFTVTINSVLGSSIRNPDDALVVARRARELGFFSSVGIIHDGRGQLRPLSPRHMAVYEEIRALGTRGFLRFNARFQQGLARGAANEWSCRAGARYLYVDEFGLVHYCSQQRGYPAVPLESYSRDDIRREYSTPKGCAPYCTVNCVQQVAILDNWRSRQRGQVRFPEGGESPTDAPASSVAPAPDRVLAG